MSLRVFDNVFLFCGSYTHLHLLEIVELIGNFALNWMLKVSAVLSFSFFSVILFCIVIMIKQQVHKRPEFPFKYMTLSILC